jgi:deferrochelatase/peroxidase EfeB
MLPVDTRLRAEGLKAMTATQAYQLINHNLEKIEQLSVQNQHLKVGNP